MLYYKWFPKPVHSLENGLTIYSLQIKSHDSKVNAAIGGPHESFARMGAHYGSMSIVFANLCQQLANYKSFGPPSIQKALFTEQDFGFVKNFKKQEMLEFQDPFEEEDEFFDCDSFFDSDEIENVEETGPACLDCGKFLAEEGAEQVKCILEVLSSSKVDDEESLTTLKQLQKAQQEGLDIQYRCPKCRSCVDCNRSHETERISIREEAEDMKIWDSVQIDWKNRRIISTLPLRGEEETFLSNNRDIALKILNQQCHTYYKDPVKEVIVKAFDKLIKNGQMVLFKDLSEEEKSIVESKPVSHWIVWRVVFKPSLSTPARIVFDGSANTKPRDDGSGGRCLNDAVVKGRVVTLNLVKMVMIFCAGLAACQGDLAQFYASIKLDSQFWNLQRILFKADMDPDGPEMEAIIKTLIWGIKCVSAMSECAVLKLASEIKSDFPNVAKMLIRARFVDDIGNSKSNIIDLKKITSDTDKIFDKVGLSCKGWTFSGENPPPEVCEEGNYVSIGGMKWYSAMDLLEIPIPPFHLSKKVRGRLTLGTDVFEGKCLEDMEKFVKKQNKGKNLTRRQVASKIRTFFDILGKFVPIENVFKIDLKKATEQTKNWDDELPNDLHHKWVQNFFRLETLKGIKFNRAIMPSNAVNCDMDVISGGDASGVIKNAGSWGRFLLDNGNYSCQLILGRSLLANSTVPKDELESLTMTSNLNWVVKIALEEWVKSSIVINDSTISLCWTKNDRKRLSLYHRNRVVQIKRGTELSQLYHVKSEFNPGDCGTRPELVTNSDVGPGSKWENGLPWMRRSISEAIDSGILTPIEKLSVKTEEESTFNEGFVFERSKEILTPGHPVVLANSRIENVAKRAQFSKYLIPPNKWSLEKTLRVYGIVFRFLKSFKCLKVKNFLEPKSDIKYQMFIVFDVTQSRPGMVDAELNYLVAGRKTTTNETSIVDVHRVYMSFGCKNPKKNFTGKYHVLITDDDISRALFYLFSKASAEVKEFNKPEFVKRISVERNGILYSRNRLLDGQRFKVAGELEDIGILQNLNIRLLTPVLDRFSPLSYAVADYVHRQISKHKGYENCYRESLNYVFIIQGMGLFREINNDCVTCSKLRKKFFEVSMGSLSEYQLTIAPPFWVCMMDLYGPCKVYPVGHSMPKRGRPVLEAVIHIIMFVCPITKIVNIQVIETKSAEGIIDGLTRLSCEVGVPSFVLTDKDSGIMKALRDTEINIKDLQYVLHKEKGIKFSTCPVSGHNYSGACERRIRILNEALVKCDVGNARLHATG